MSSTLIVSDATLAINGTLDPSLEPREHFVLRVGETACFDEQTVADCIEVLTPSASGDEADPEVLEALVILAISHPVQAGELGIDASTYARRLALRLLDAGLRERAAMVLEEVAQAYPGDRALQREIENLVNRQNKGEELVDSYLARAEAALRQGQIEQAINWYREILRIDDSRRDVARIIRDLRYQEDHVVEQKSWRWRIAAAALLVSASLSYLALREVRLARDFAAVPAAVEGDVKSMTARLEGLDRFVDQHPIWHGSLGALSERGDLRVGLERLRLEREAKQARDEERDRQRRERAELARRRGLMAAHASQYEKALEEFQEALELAPEDWSGRERTRLDVASIQQHLAGDKSGGQNR